MFYPQASFYPQPNLYPHGSFGGQGNFNTQAGFGTLGSPGNPYIPVNALYGVPPLTPPFAPQTASQQQAIQQLLAQQSMRQPGFNGSNGILGLNGVSNGAAQLGAWPQQQLNQEQINPAFTQPPSYHHLLQQLAQYHHFIAQQLTQLAAQSVQGIAGAYPFAGQFIPSQLGANFIPGTMH